MERLRDAYIEGRKVEYSLCEHCNHPSLWTSKTLVYPLTGGFLLPNEDMPDEVKDVYMEAGSIARLSPRAACALLRLALELLLIHLGESRHLDTAIGNLAKKGLDPEIRKAMDTLRVTGNHAIHAGKIRIDSDSETDGLFGLLNAIVYNCITQPRQIEEMYSKLPKSARNHIAKRDCKTNL